MLISRVVEPCVVGWKATSPALSTFHHPRSTMLRLPDAHAHPQNDLEHAAGLQHMRVSAVAVMGVKEADWDNVLEMQRLVPTKVIPCFGVHPWFAHLHASVTAEAAVPAPGSPAPSLPEPGGGTAAADDSARPSSMFVLPAGHDPACLQPLLASPPSTTWAARLEELLQVHPHAVVGECGLDRASVIPGTKVSVSLDHQVALVRTHLLLAARHRRPISMHCVRATGAMQDLLKSLSEDQLPPRIMMHSFGGPGEAIRQMLSIHARGLGGRLWFSFSSVINVTQGNRDKLMDRVRAVPPDRVLIESDQDSVTRMEEGLDAILEVVAEAHGWTTQQAAEVAVRNFEAFYDGFLPQGQQQQL